MYEVIPVNGKILLKKATIDDDEQEQEQVTFYSGSPTQEKVELFEIISIAPGPDDYCFQKGDLVTVEHAHPLGKINGIELFVTDGRSISTRIIKKEE